MIDCHSHILFNIDDGCINIEDSILTIKNLYNLGFDKIVLTPHYIKGSDYLSINKEDKKEELEKRLKEEKINVELFLGNEIYIFDEIIEHLNENKMSSINNSKYILIELPLYDKINNIEDYIHEIKVNGYIPIIAHPERYLYYQKDYKKLKELKDMGVLFQCNYSSIIDNYGKEARKLFKYLLRKNLVDILSTDVHRPNSTVIKEFDLIKKKLIRKIGKTKFRKLSYETPLKILNNE